MRDSCTSEENMALKSLRTNMVRDVRSKMETPTFIMDDALKKLKYNVKQETNTQNRRKIEHKKIEMGIL
ncbi:hypothetical protein CTI12_AA167420 [Artemisia annua]|uniref:Uncharacterized protein n=1 Tax=Artemisia annua TaxID=35608 RepID=A0A2U1PCS9_ARTAN|nr:hypothetical protein CTI12_AA167420 [Artemisia annua]